MKHPMYMGPGQRIGPNDLAPYELDTEYVAQEKIDGCWACLRVTRGSITSATSRQNLLLPCRRVDIGVPGNGVLVGEVVNATDVYIHDVIKWEKQYTARWSQRQRYSFVEELYRLAAMTGKPDWQVIRQKTTNFKRFYKQVIRRGGEGLVLKPRHMQYQSGLTKHWVKVKPVEGK